MPERSTSALRRWFDHWLKGQDSGVLDEAPLRLFVMGDNRWRDEREWPLARTEWTALYLHSQGRANTLYGDGRLSRQAPVETEAPDHYAFDPSKLVPTLGGALLPGAALAGPFDQRAIERRPDVLVYTSEPLPRAVEVTGPVAVELWVSSSSAETDFTARLVDVQADGRALNVCDGVIRAQPLQPGAIYA
jgi:putative CocE/NonD family hydrolase